MKEVRMLHLSAIEADGTLTIGVSIGIQLENGQHCTKRRQLTYDSTEQPCCMDDWVGEVLGTLDDPNEEVRWVYEHGAGCEQHEEHHDDL